MSKLIQKTELFKHDHVFTGYADGTPYLYNKTNNGVVDGIDRMHIDLYAKCDICNKEILVAKIHCDKEGKLYKGVYNK